MKFKIKNCGNINWVKIKCQICDKMYFESFQLNKEKYFCEHIRQELEKIGLNDLDVMKKLDYESNFAFNWEEIEIN
jgi:coproporphyrinogen III oxidase